MSENETMIDAPRHYFLVGMGTNAATRTLRRASRGQFRGRKVRIGPFLVRPNRTVPLTPEQVEEYAAPIELAIAQGRIQLQDGSQRPLLVCDAVSSVLDMPDITEADPDELLTMLDDAKGDPALYAHVRSAIVDGAVARVEASNDLEELTNFADTLVSGSPLAMAEIELACALRIKELRDAEAAQAAEASPEASPETVTETPVLADTIPEVLAADEADEDAPPYSEWDYAALKAEAKSRELDPDSQKKDDLVAALEMDDELDDSSSEG